MKRQKFQINKQYNELSCVIPYNICNIHNIEYIIIENNQFCPPYPECIEHVGYQDTSECIECSEYIGDLNNNLVVDIVDIISLINCILENDVCNECYDITGEGNAEVVEIIGLVNIIFFALNPFQHVSELCFQVCLVPLLV